MGIRFEEEQDGATLYVSSFSDGEVEIHARKNVRKLAETFGCLCAYRKQRLVIRHAEKARKEARKNGNH